MKLKVISFSLRSLMARASLLTMGLCLALYSTSSDGMAQSRVVRLAVVIDLKESDLLADILPDFEKQTGYQVDVKSGTGTYIFDLARNGNADLVISHYGHSEVESLVTEGLGLWPHTVFANQSALLGPGSDPAHIRELSDAIEGFRRIAETKSPFLVNNLPVIKYLERVLWEGAGRPEKGDWYIDLDLQGQKATEKAAEIGAYTLWGLNPFLRFQEQHNPDLQALLFNDALLQQMMVSIVVNPKNVPGVNFEGAQAFQQYLIAPATQARLRAFRFPGFDYQIWWASGLNNDVAGIE